MNPQDRLPTLFKSSEKSPFVDFKGHIINVNQIRLIFKGLNSETTSENRYELIIDFGGDVKIRFVYAEEAGRDRDFESIKDVLSYHAG